MKDVKVLGPGCKRCKAMEATEKNAAARLGIDIDIEVERITDCAEIAKFGIASTPGIVINGNFVHAGGWPKQEALEKWLQA